MNRRILFGAFAGSDWRQGVADYSAAFRPPAPVRFSMKPITICLKSAETGPRNGTASSRRCCLISFRFDASVGGDLLPFRGLSGLERFEFIRRARLRLDSCGEQPA